MTLLEAQDYEGKIVKVTCIDDQQIQGLMWPCVPAWDSTRERDEIELFTGGASVVIPIEEVTTIEIME